jgi:hypothetical protein
MPAAIENFIVSEKEDWENEGAITDPTNQAVAILTEKSAKVFDWVLSII